MSGGSPDGTGRDTWTKIPCNCWVAWNGTDWIIESAAFTCDHKPGDRCDGAPPEVQVAVPAPPISIEREELDEIAEALAAALDHQNKGQYLRGWQEVSEAFAAVKDVLDRSRDV